VAIHRFRVMLLRAHTLIADELCIVCSEGMVYGWGMNRYGQLGTGDNVDASSPTEVEVFSMLCSKITRVIVVWNCFPPARLA